VGVWGCQIPSGNATSGKSSNGIVFPVFYDQGCSQGYIFAPLLKSEQHSKFRQIARILFDPWERCERSTEARTRARYPISSTLERRQEPCNAEEREVEVAEFPAPWQEANGSQVEVCGFLTPTLGTRGNVNYVGNRRWRSDAISSCLKGRSSEGEEISVARSTYNGSHAKWRLKRNESQVNVVVFVAVAVDMFRCVCVTVR
jgi:hypothetical protein